MNLVLSILSVLVLVGVKTTTAASLGHQLIAPGNGVMDKKCIDLERHALLDFKALLQDPNGRLSTWRAEEKEDDCCKWIGVTCNNHTGHVIKLDLVYGGLEGEISPSLLNLTYMTYLDLYGNSFNGTIPKSIDSLTELRYLDLSLNSFYGTIPSEFGNLTNLQSLSLGNLTSCTIKSLDWLSHLSRLDHLDMHGISLAKANNWVNVILSLQKLSYLSLSQCDLSQVMHPYTSSSFVNSSSSSSSIVFLFLEDNNLNSSMYPWLFPLTGNKLDTLYLHGNKLDGIPKYLGNLCSLTSLYLHNNSVAAKFSDFLYNLSGCTSVTLQELRASGSQFIGSLSDDIQKFSSLESLDLSHNQLNGTISEKVWELPKLQYLDLSSNYLRGAISPNIVKSKIGYIDLSNNSLEGVPSKTQMTNLSNYIEYIDMSSCRLGPHFPKWIQTLKNLIHLDISNNGISDTIPTEFWNMWPFGMTYLDLSSNNINGKVTDLRSNFGSLFSRIDLSSNNFSGSIRNVPPGLETLNLSNNKFSGGIFFLCQIVDGLLTYLDLSNNSLSGEIPDCLWHFKQLKVLNLGHNNLSGRLPASVEYLIELEVLYLYNNKFSGELNFSLKNCTKLTFLDLGDNKFSGNVPVWIGENLSQLYVLSLRSNEFFGPIPSQLCQLINLQILDLSMNILGGNIPSCVKNLTTMVQKIFLQPQGENLHSMGNLDFFPLLIYFDHTMIKWQGNVREVSSTLGVLTSIDLSRNNLTGQIPYELTNLHGLIALDLSHNSLIGEIPQDIGVMKELLTLNLSRNNFSGRIPSSMSQMASLNCLDVSYNNLSGRVPTSTQLQSFEPSWFTGNAGLCGLPVANICPGDEGLQAPPRGGEMGGYDEVGDELKRWFYIGGASGFATGFWIVCSALLLYRRGRHAFFHFLDSLNDWVYVKVMLAIANWRRVAYTQ